MPEVLCRSSDVKEILWIFSQYPKDSDEKKRLSLRKTSFLYKITR